MISSNKSNNQSNRFYGSFGSGGSGDNSICDKCKIIVTTPFCTKCGQKVGGPSQKSSICGQCGITVTTPFCTQCGKKAIQSSTPTVARQEVDTGQNRADPNKYRNLVTQASKQGTSDSARNFTSLVERSIVAWNSLTYADDPDITGSLSRLSTALRSFDSIDDLFRSRIMFWFFQRRESFMKQTQFIKWDLNRLDEYVLLPMDEGYVNKKDCFYVSHFWRTREAPDPRDEDFKLVHQDLSTQQWTYVWADWTCLPQGARTPAEREYTNRMLMRTPVLMRECGFEWRYPDFQPRLWILVEVAQYMLNIAGNYAVTADIKPYIDDVQAMKTEGVQQVITRRGYNCSVSREYRLLVGWLELLVILSKLVPDVPMKKFILDALEPPHVGSFEHVDTGIEVNKSTGIVSYQGAVYRFAPLYPVDADGFPK